jgi:hypothetical protein
LQKVKNDQLKKENVEDSGDNFFMYRQQDSEYFSFQSMLINKDWDTIESKDNNAGN